MLLKGLREINDFKQYTSLTFLVERKWVEVVYTLVYPTISQQLKRNKHICQNFKDTANEWLEFNQTADTHACIYKC